MEIKETIKHNIVVYVILEGKKEVASFFSKHEADRAILRLKNRRKSADIGNIIDYSKL